jgi:lipopolysaccharide export LptBFGC system permease protein LptF
MELRDYLEELRVAGFEVGHLRTDLHTKLAFPFVSMIMVVLGVPFALSIGRKGTLYGVALGVFLGIFYWGAFGVFEVLGNNGLLAPILAAWGPNLVVGSSSLFLLFSAKT